MGVFDSFIKAIYKGPDPLEGKIKPEPENQEIKKFNDPILDGKLHINTDQPVDPEYVTHFENFLKEKNMPGPDYFEFATTLHEMDEIAAGMTEQQKFLATYMGFKVQNVNSDALAASGKKYLELLKEHDSLFSESLKKENLHSVEQKQLEIKSLENANADTLNNIATMQKKILEMQADIQANKDKIEQSKLVIQQETGRIENKKKKFELAYSVIVRAIQQDIDKIILYLTPKK